MSQPLKERALYVGMVMYGNQSYTKMAVQSIMDTYDGMLVFVIVNGKPGSKFPFENHGNALFREIKHEKNLGFPQGVNDIMKHIFVDCGEDVMLFVGNDTIAYPEAIDNLLYAYRGYEDLDYISAREMKSEMFQYRYPQHKWWFDNQGGLDYQTHIPETEAFYESKPYLSHYNDLKRTWGTKAEVRDINFINGFHNFALIKRSYYEKVGNVDVGFYPAYFEDIDLVRRGNLAGCHFAEVSDAWYFHFVSQTVKNETSRMHQRFFPLNNLYYQAKWGGPPGNEAFVEPKELTLHEGSDEQTINYWRWTPRPFANRHKNQRCIIVAPGPSINDIDLNLIGDEVTIYLNGAFEIPLARPTYSIAVNPKILSRWPNLVDQEDVEGIFVPAGLNDDWWRPNVYGLWFTHPKDRRFVTDLTQPIYQGHTVTFCALQLAYYMGFNRVALIGLDHYYQVPEGVPTNKAIVSEGADPNHYDPGYFGKGVEWDTPNLPRSEEAYQMAKDAFEVDGRAVVNCSTKTALDIFDRMTLEEFLED